MGEREKKGIDDVAIVRVEQISPFPFDKVAEEMSKYVTLRFTQVERGVEWSLELPTLWCGVYHL